MLTSYRHLTRADAVGMTSFSFTGLQIHVEHYRRKGAEKHDFPVVSASYSHDVLQ